MLVSPRQRPANLWATDIERFYVTGGTLPADAPSYVCRDADEDLCGALLRGEFCHILTSRQTGKSSLMARTAMRLRQKGVTVAALDLTAVGQNLTAEQWYDGLLGLLGRQLDLEDEMDDFWLAHPRFGPLQRWTEAIRLLVLGRFPGPVVIFVDELDAVLSLPFPTDEFFAAIRECHNRRSEDADFCRLTFCLIGVAAPSDLIRDARTTPFNVGRRIELTDFSDREAGVLARGLCQGGPAAPALLGRILWWTGGHPYLTQRLCQAAARREARLPTDVDRACAELFLGPRPQDRDNNLLFVHQRMLHGSADPAGILDLYAQVRSRWRTVSDDERDPLVGALRLSGIVRAVCGRLRVRNRIYESVFDRQWIRANMPGAELRRQQDAFRRGLVRSGTASALLLTVMGGLTWQAVRESRFAGAEALTSQQYLYVADMNLAGQALEQGDPERAAELLQALVPKPGQRDLRGFEWRYLWRTCHCGEVARLEGHRKWVSAAVFSPRGGLLATASYDGSVILWEYPSCRLLARLGQGTPIYSAAFSPDGKTLAVGRFAAVELWDVTSHNRRALLRGHTNIVRSLAFSPDGRFLATGSEDGTARLWSLAPPRQNAAINTGQGQVLGVAFSPDGKVLSTVGKDGTAHLWGMPGGSGAAVLAGNGGPILSVAYSPDGKTLAAGSSSHAVLLWDTRSHKRPALLAGQDDLVTCVKFSPDGSLVATGAANGTVQVWHLPFMHLVAVIRGHRSAVHALSFSPDGQVLATASQDRTTGLWDVAGLVGTLDIRDPGGAHSAALSPDGRALATNSDGGVQLWDTATGSQIGPLRGATGKAGTVAFSGDGRTLAAVAGGCVRTWGLANDGTVAMGEERCCGADHLAFSGDGRTLAASTPQGQVWLWNMAVGKVTVLPGRSSLVTALSFQPHGAILAVAGEDNWVRLLDTRADRQVGILTAHQSAVYGIAYSPDGKVLATASGDGTTRLWDADTWKPVMVLRHAATAVAFSPDGRTVATGQSDGAVRLWQTATGQEVLTLRSSGPVISVAFASNGSDLEALEQGGPSRIWRAVGPAVTKK